MITSSWTYVKTFFREEEKKNIQCLWCQNTIEGLIKRRIYITPCINMNDLLKEYLVMNAYLYSQLAFNLIF